MPPVNCTLSLERICRTKVVNARYRDEQQLGQCRLDVQTLCEMALSSDGVCPGCACTMLFQDYDARCWHQFSPDRLDRNLPHSKDNVRLVCLSCNCKGLGVRKRPCPSGCHPGDLQPRLLPWGSAPVPAPNPADVPLPTFVSDAGGACGRRAATTAQPCKRAREWEEQPPKRRCRLVPALLCAQGLLEG